MASQWGWDKKIKALKEAKYDLPKKLAEAGQLYYQQNFDKQQWDGNKWEEVKRRIPGTPEYKYPKDKGLSRRVKPILVNTGKLRQSMQNSVREVSEKKITWGTDVSYAKYLNPERKFIGGSKDFMNKMKEKIKYAYDKVMKAK